MFLGENERLLKENSNENEENNIDSDIEEDVKINLAKMAKWQQGLLLKYGNELSLLDATYKIAGYALPLLFLVVKTNVD